MRKYVSCIILIVACIVCAMIFYVNATSTNEMPEMPSGGDSQETSSSDEGERKIAFSDKGTIMSEYFCSSRLRIEWSSIKYTDSASLYISAELILDTPYGIGKTCTASLAINGARTDFTVNPSSETSVLLGSSSIEITDFTDGSIIYLDGTINLEFVGEGGVCLSALNANGKIYQGGGNLKESSSLSGFEHISQYPSLPSGDEITSLAMVFRYLKYNVDPCNLCDLYLDKGPVGFTDFNKANIGNPRDTYNSYGCLAPVIVNSATRFINANGGTHKAYDYSGYEASELYRQTSLGSPVIVWLCDDFGSTPSISRIWVVDGKTIYLKSNMACMVLIGYDYTKGTVTLANPAGNTFTLEMSAFEKGYADMGSYAVVIK